MPPPESSDEHAGPPRQVDVSVPFPEARDRALAEFEREYVATILQQHGGDVAGAARAAGVSRVYLYRLIKRHGLRADGSSL